MKKFAILFSLHFIFISVCYADLNNCNGTWTNKPCDGLSRVPEEKKENTSDPDKSKKESLLHDLRMLSLESRRDYEIRYDISLTERTCKYTDLVECDKAIKAAQRDLQELKTKAQLIKTKKERNELIKESNLLKKERNEIEAKKPGVLIQQNTILIPPRRPPIWRDSPPLINNRSPVKNNLIKDILIKDTVIKDAASSDQSSSLPTNVR